jgi:hypothetical protein
MFCEGLQPGAFGRRKRRGIALSWAVSLKALVNVRYVTHRGPKSNILRLPRGP